MTAMSPKNTYHSWADKMLRGLIYTGSFIAIIFLLVYDRTGDSWDMSFTEGLPSPRTVYAPFDISYVNERATEEARLKGEEKVAPVYRIDSNIGKEAIQKARAFLEELKNIQKISSDRKKSRAMEALMFPLSELEIEVLLAEEDLAGWADYLGKNLEEIFANGVIDTEDKFGLLARGRNQILILDEKEERNWDCSGLSTQVDANEKILVKLEERSGRNRKLRDAFLKLAGSVIRPNLIWDEAATQKRKEAAQKSTPEIRQEYKKGEMVILRGRRVNDEHISALLAIQKRTQSREILKRTISQTLIVLLLFLILAGYFRYFEPAIGSSAKYLLLIHGTLVLSLVISKWILFFGWSSYLIPVSLTSLLLVPLIKSRIGLSMGIFASILSSLLCGWSLEVLLYGFMGSLLGVFGAVGIRKRIQFVKVGLWVGVAQGITIYASQLFQGVSVVEASQTALLGLANGLLVTLPLFSLLLPLLEQLFNLTTDITLLELSDLNHPLLKRMVIEAPGTYHHSLIVSHLAEEAAKGVDANPLLARVGAYFHDIGKMARSEYFSENQQTKEESKHNQLSPSMSSLIIMSHVKKGVELAKKFKLKEVIIDFIPEHQGTSVVYFFYRKALEKANPGEVVNPDDYRYPGPKPQSKETAIVMMADSVEAASRSLAEYTPETIRELVERVVFEKLGDRQFDECDLTLKNLDEIRESFIRNLLGVYHTRIPYPKLDEEPSKKKTSSRHHPDPLEKISAR